LCRVLARQSLALQLGLRGSPARPPAHLRTRTRTRTHTDTRTCPHQNTSHTRARACVHITASNTTNTSPTFTTTRAHAHGRTHEQRAHACTHSLTHPRLKISRCTLHCAATRGSAWN
jgi:hypothetical protein